MIYYKTDSGDIYGYETAQERMEFGAPDLVELTAEELTAFLNPVVAVPVPQKVTRAQGKAALIVTGLWPQVLAYVASITDPTQQALAEVALNDALHWERQSPLLNAIIEHLDLTSEQVDQVFIDAAAIQL